MKDALERIQEMKKEIKDAAEAKQETATPLCTIRAAYMPGLDPIISIQGDLVVADGLISYIKEMLKDRFDEHINLAKKGEPKK